MPTSRGNLIIIGASARAAAQSAIRAGYSPWCIDLFADRDLQAIAPVKRCPREAWPEGVLGLLKDAPEGPVLFTGAMENHLEVVEAIESSFRLIGSGAVSMRVARTPQRLAELCQQAWDELGAAWEHRAQGLEDLPYPAGPSSPRIWDRVPWWKAVGWIIEQWTGVRRIVKPRCGSGGHRIRHWHWRWRVAPDEYVQQLLPEGTATSVVFRADGGQAHLLGATEQITGDETFGASSPFIYVGNIGPVALPMAVKQQLDQLGNILVRAAGLSGLFGVDAIMLHTLLGTVPLSEVTEVNVLEVNPRYVASVEIHERASDASLLLSDSTPSPPDPQRIFGKAIVYAKTNARVPDLMAELGIEVGDVPMAGELIEQGHPVCTVFAEASSRDECLAKLRESAAQVYTRLRPI